MVECNLAKVDVEGSNPFSRSQARPRAATQIREAREAHEAHEAPQPPLRLPAKKNAAVSLEPFEPPRFFFGIAAAVSGETSSRCSRRRSRALFVCSMQPLP